MASASSLFIALPVVSPSRLKRLPVRCSGQNAGSPATSSGCTGGGRTMVIGRPIKGETPASALTALALAAALVVPEVAEAAQPGISPSLRNFLLSIASGGLILAVLLGAVIAVANFDPVKRK